MKLRWAGGGGGGGGGTGHHKSGNSIDVDTIWLPIILIDIFIKVSMEDLNGHICSTRLLGRPQPQMYPPVALNQHTLVNRTHKHYIYMLQGPTNILKSNQSSTICKICK